MRAILILSLAFGLLTGCSREVYLKPGQVIEIRTPVTIRVWVRNVDTGKLEARHVNAQAGWYVGRPVPQ